MKQTIHGLPKRRNSSDVPLRPGSPFLEFVWVLNSLLMRREPSLSPIQQKKLAGFLLNPFLQTMRLSFNFQTSQKSSIGMPEPLTCLKELLKSPEARVVKIRLFQSAAM